MKKTLSLLLCFVLLSALLLSGCGGKANVPAPEEAIKTVITQLFTGPRAAYSAYMQEDLPEMGLETMDPGEVQGIIKSGVQEKILAAMREDKKNAVTDSLLEGAWNNGLYEIQSFCLNSGCTTKVTNVEVSPTDSEYVYSFVATIACSGNGDAEVQIKGQGSFDADKALQNITYDLDTIDTLVEAVR